MKATVIFADKLMYTGYDFSTESGASIGVNDFYCSKEKAAIIEKADGREVTEIRNSSSHPVW